MFDYPTLKHGFNRSANSCQLSSALALEVGSRLLERLDYIDCKPKAILDLGCGTGEISHQLRARFSKARFFGLDLAERRVAEAKLQAKRRQYFIAGNAEQLPIADNSIDMVFSNQCFYWCDHKKLMPEIFRVLKPGGLLLFSSLGPDSLYQLRQAFAAIDQGTHINNFTDMHDIGDWLLQTGFKDPVMDVDQIDVSYNNIAAAITDLKNQGERNYLKSRQKSLMGKHLWQQLMQQSLTALTYEVIYGHAWGVKLLPRQNPQEFFIDPSSITRRRI